MPNSSSRIFVSIPEDLRKLAEPDIQNRRLSGRVQRFLQVVYANGGAVDSIHMRRTEVKAEIARLEAELIGLDAQESSIHEVQAQEHDAKRAEDAFRKHVRAAMEQNTKIRWIQWLSPTRADVKPIGMRRAKAILKEESGVQL